MDDIEHKLEPNDNAANDDRLQAAERVLEPNGATGDDDPSSGPTFEERLTKLAETFVRMDFLPREDAWH
jgi:hypothetical protein